MKPKKVWLVTGASKGLGLTLVKKLLKEGYRVAATSRDINMLNEEIGQHTKNSCRYKQILSITKVFKQQLPKSLRLLELLMLL